MPRCRLYLISPDRIEDLPGFADLLDRVLDAGDVACVQLRLKHADDDRILSTAEGLRPVCHGHDVALILNDRPDLARAAGCDGVHLGQQDTAYDDARALLGPDATIGITCHDSRHLAMVAAENGADYVAFGAFYPTATKDAPTRATPDLLRWWADMMVVPSVAIGGITPENAAPLVTAGADFLAACAGVWRHPEGPVAAVQAFNAVFDACPTDGD